MNEKYHVNYEVRGVRLTVKELVYGIKKMVKCVRKAEEEVTEEDDQCSAGRLVNNMADLGVLTAGKAKLVAPNLKQTYDFRYW